MILKANCNMRYPNETKSKQNELNLYTNSNFWVIASEGKQNLIDAMHKAEIVLNLSRFRILCSFKLQYKRYYQFLRYIPFYFSRE